MGRKTELLTAVKPGFTTISPDRNTVASFDREGRLFSFVKDGRTYRRTLDSTVEVRWRGDDLLPGAGRPRQRKRLAPDDARSVFIAAYDAARSVRSDAAGQLRTRLDREILRWTPELLLGEAERFARVYKPIPILPPDQYLSIVLQATEGCTWNRCTFCTFYQDRPFRVKSAAEFQEHVDGVAALFGRGASMRKSVFLADGNALALSESRLGPMMEKAKNAFPNLPLYSFIDLYSGDAKSVQQWRHLAELGLRRVYIGMETGLDELLAVLNKPGSREELIDFVARLHAAGVAVGLIVMMGIGGASYKQAHAAATVDAIRRMSLNKDKGDLVYLSPFVEQADSAYAQLRQAHGIEPLAENEVEDELRQLALQIRSVGVKAARYDIREFMY